MNSKWSLNALTAACVFLLVLVTAEVAQMIWMPTPAQAAVTINVNYTGVAGDGFLDAGAADGTSTSPGATIGAQRKASFEAAAAKWATNLTSNVTIEINATMVDQGTPASCFILGGAGAAGSVLGWAAAGGGSVPAFAGTWYPRALGNKIANTDLSVGSVDISATMNLFVDSVGCATKWVYHNNATQTGGRVAFFTTALHEIGHGLGFASHIDAATGALNGAGGPCPCPGVYDKFLEIHSTGQIWGDLDDTAPSRALRVASSISGTDLHWHRTGSLVTAGNGVLTGGGGLSGGHVMMYAPNPFEPGSSVSHWAPTLITPVAATCQPGSKACGSRNEFMEHSDAPPDGFILTDELMCDIGWCANASAVVPVELQSFGIDDQQDSESTQE